MEDPIKDKIGFIIMILVALLAIAYCGKREAEAKMIPVVSASELEGHDKEEVVIYAYIRSCEALKGRLGSNYVKCLFGTGTSEFFVYADFQIFGHVGDKFVVFGKYRKEGWFGGHLAENFIAAKFISRELGGGE